MTLLNLSNRKWFILFAQEFTRLSSNTFSHQSEKGLTLHLCLPFLFQLNSRPLRWEKWTRQSDWFLKDNNWMYEIHGIRTLISVLVWHGCSMLLSQGAKWLRRCALWNDSTQVFCCKICIIIHKPKGEVFCCKMCIIIHKPKGEY